MTTTNGDVSTVLIDKVADWMMQTAMAGADVEEIAQGFCERLAAAGMPLKRVHLSFSILHPLYRASGFTWRRGEGINAENYRHVTGNQTDRFKNSPYYYLLRNNLDHMRRRFDPAEPAEFPIFTDLMAEGITDYIAFLRPFDTTSSQGMMGSWSTDRPGGFSENMISALLRIQNQLAVAAKMAVLSKLADNMLTTYLGKESGRRVLSGQIKRGDAETVRAALVLVDMRNSTKIAEQHGRQVFIDTLNTFYDAVATPFNKNGGQILSFMGDGFLAVYPCERSRSLSKIACRAALAATGMATARMSELNQKRAAQGLWEIGYGIGLHVGNVIFGNVGLPDRLTFSTFGAEVNEVQRIESLTKKYPSRIAASESFANYCEGDWTMLASETLRGFSREVKIFAPTGTNLAQTAMAEAVESNDPGLSNAEHLMILHRESKKAAVNAGLR